MLKVPSVPSVPRRGEQAAKSQKTQGRISLLSILFKGMHLFYIWQLSVTQCRLGKLVQVQWKESLKPSSKHLRWAHVCLSRNPGSRAGACYSCKAPAQFGQKGPTGSSKLMFLERCWQTCCRHLWLWKWSSNSLTGPREVFDYSKWRPCFLSIAHIQ